MLSRLPIDMLTNKVAMDVGMIGTSLVVKYSDNSLQYINLDRIVAFATGKADFYFDMAHRISVLERGKTVSDTITIIPVKDFTANVSFKAVDVPNGLNITFAPESTKLTTTISIRCDASAKLGQHVISIEATAVGGLVRQFDLIVTITNAGSGFSLNALPNNPVNGQHAVLASTFTTQNNQLVPANIPLMYMQHTGWQPDPTYKGTFGNWAVVKHNTSQGLTTRHHIQRLYRSAEIPTASTPAAATARAMQFAKRARGQSNRHAKQKQKQ